MVSERTRAALAVRKAQGPRLGNRTNLARAQQLGAARTAEAACRFAENTRWGGGSRCHADADTVWAVKPLWRRRRDNQRHS